MPPIQPKPQAGRKDEPEAPDVERHDEVYFRHKAGPKVGKVLSRGEHGCIIEADGERHKVRWDAFLGHKSKVHATAKVIDEGDDGLIVEHAHGGRRFVRDPLGLIEPSSVLKRAKPMRKSAALVLMPASDEMLKAIKGNPGLRLEDRTDKTGRRSKHWVKIDKGQPKAKPHAANDQPSDLGKHNVKSGHHVRFKAGAFHGEGHVVGEPGEHGAHVRDKTGREHRVLYSEVTHHEGQPRSSAGAGGDGEDGDGSDDDFTAADYAKQFDDGELTEEDVLGDFDDHVRTTVSRAAERVLTIKQTVEHYKARGTYTAERHAVQRKIVQQILSPEAIEAATPEDGEQPKLILLGGRGGSGKSSLDGMVYDAKKAITIDPDAIKSMLPEYQGWNAHEVHEESSDIADDIMSMARQMGLNVVIDGTMKNADSSLKRLREFRDDGYRVEAHYMHLPRPVAAKRAVQRFMTAKNDGSGRFVPVSVLVGNTTNEAAFDRVRREADAWTFHDNQGEKGSKPKLIASGQKK